MDLSGELTRILAPDRVTTRRIDRVALANDASVYRLMPRAVVHPISIDEIRALFALSQRLRIPLTFRAAGTSLSGQAVTDGILVVLSRHWGKVVVEDDGRRVRVQPGVIGGVVNQHLREHGAKIGPDPASINSCMMGGILANNSSGMCCGVQHNAYHTLESISFVLPDGLALDTGNSRAKDELAREAPGLVQGLLDLKARIGTNATLRERIRTKYKLKNTMGYSLNAFCDFSAPLDILAHLMIGSEGTLGFIAEAVLNTIPDDPLKYTGLLFFPDVPRACAAVAALREAGARTLELMDRASLRSIEHQPGVPPRLCDLPAGAAAILVEFQSGTEDELARCEVACRRLLPSLPLIEEPTFTRDPELQAALWRVRKGIIPSVGAMRRRGTSCIIEDVVFPPDRLARGVAELQELCAAHGYDDVVVFGHARDGNLHFVLTQAFHDPAEIERYDAFMRALAELVAVRHGGALKAEHGTGRNMAPFVVTEWGEDAYRIMLEVKRLIDPDGLLNPGVILNDDPRAHVADLKSLPTVESEVDHCIECGFCEHLCPSRNLTLTPRQRIVVRREMARLRGHDPHDPALAELENDFDYDGLATCATDGLCATACPVGIDTGQLVKRLRCRSHSATSQELARIVADRFSWLERAVRLGLRGARMLGRDLPHAARGLPVTSRVGAAAVYFPSCISRMVGPAAAQDPAVAELVVEVSTRAGLPLWIPDDVAGHCCGLAFSSKGFMEASSVAIDRMVEALWRWSDRGRLPIVFDTSPCAQTLKQAGGELSHLGRHHVEKLRLLDGIEFLHDEVLPRRRPRRIDGPVALHPVCSVRKMSLEAKLQRVAEACAETVDVPPSAGCCGFAGDRGFSHPELTEAATRGLAAELAGRSYHGCYSTSRTCEIGLARATGRPYRPVWSLIEEATRDPAGPGGAVDGGVPGDGRGGRRAGHGRRPG